VDTFVRSLQGGGLGFAVCEVKKYLGRKMRSLVLCEDGIFGMSGRVMSTRHKFVTQVTQVRGTSDTWMEYMAWVGL
jgi:hypothetical protein